MPECRNLSHQTLSALKLFPGYLAVSAAFTCTVRRVTGIPLTRVSAEIGDRSVHFLSLASEALCGCFSEYMEAGSFLQHRTFAAITVNLCPTSVFPCSAACFISNHNKTFSKTL
jgi:hypothetical protein